MSRVEGAYCIVRISLRYLLKRRIQILQGVKGDSQFLRNVCPIHKTGTLCQDLVIFLIIIGGRKSAANGVIMPVRSLIYKLQYRVNLKIHIRIGLMELI